MRHSTATPHQKQFILGPHSVSVDSTWSAVDVAPGLVLSFSPDLLIKSALSADGVQYYLLGLAVSALRGETDLPRRISSVHSSEVQRITALWAGRWAMLSARACWCDASGSLGLYHRASGDATWLSSSPALLGEHISSLPTARRIAWTVNHQVGMDWVPNPMTTREGVYTLLPLRTIAPYDGTIHSLDPLPSHGPIVDDCVTTTVANWTHAPYRRRLLGLTAGLDTRTVLAAASAVGATARTFTVKTPYLSHADRTLPPRLAKAVGYEHELISAETHMQDADEVTRRSQVALEHTDGLISHPISQHFASGRLDYADDKSLSEALGTAFELARCYYWPTFRAAELTSEPPTAERLLSCFFSSRPAPYDYWIHACTLWLESLDDRNTLQMDWRDRFYLDQRLGAWNSTVQRTSDLVARTAFCPANCLWLFAQLLEIDECHRRRGGPQKDLIGRLAPALARFPYNPIPLHTRVHRRVRQTVRLRTRMGLRSGS